MDYRVEDKYLIREDQIAYLEMKLSSYMHMDGHGDRGNYLIRSLYFDDYRNSCLEANEAGTDHRAKYRIRAYDRNPSLILLEEKSKRAGYTHKESEAFSYEWLQELLDCRDMTDVSALQWRVDDTTPRLVQQLIIDMQTRLIHPVVIVEYERRAYVEEFGNVRITIDRNIGGCQDISAYWEPVMPVKPTLPTGTHVLEVKYDELLPDYIKSIIDTVNLKRISYSKYYQARTNI